MLRLIFYFVLTFKVSDISIFEGIIVGNCYKIGAFVTNAFSRGYGTQIKSSKHHGIIKIFEKEKSHAINLFVNPVVYIRLRWSRLLTLSSIRTSLFCIHPHGAIPMAMTGFCDVDTILKSFTASPTYFITPAWVPLVTIHASAN